MADGTDIEWARHPVTGKGASWNPVLARRLDNGKVGYHCEHASPGCEFCYAEAFNRRGLPARGTKLPFKPGHRKDVEIFADAKQLILPLQWKDPRGIFVCSMTDLFGEFVSDEIIDTLFAVMALASHHVFMVLTKRPKRMREYLGSGRATAVGMKALEITMLALQANPRSKVGEGVTLTGDIAHLAKWPLPNVWLGTSVEDQRRANERIPELVATPAARRFLSVEPILEPVDLRHIEVSDGVLLDPLFGTWEKRAYLRQTTGMSFEESGEKLRAMGPLPEQTGSLDWIILGGESGTQARTFAEFPDVARSMRDQCKATGVKFFFKQWGSWAFAPDGMNFEQAKRWAEQDHLGAPPFYRDEAWGHSGWGVPARYEHFSNGRSAFYAGKHKAGRLLDGIEHNAMPEA